MIVFVVWTEHYEEEHIVGIYDTKEKAECALRAQGKCVYGFDELHCGRIQEMEVQ